MYSTDNEVCWRLQFQGRERHATAVLARSVAAHSWTSGSRCRDSLHVALQCIRDAVEHNIRSVPLSTLSMLISSFVMSKLDYCNVALAGLPSCGLDRLQSVINAACLTVGAQRHDHITPLLADLHWLALHYITTLCPHTHNACQAYRSAISTADEASRLW